MSLFGTDGIRGIANRGPLTPARLLQLAEAIGGWLRRAHGDDARVLIIRDTRRSGPMIEGALAAGLAGRGIDVGLGGILPTPALSVCVPRLGYQAGIVLSASHNAAPDNGIKIFGADGQKLSDDAQAELERALEAAEDADGPTGDAIGAIAPEPGARELYIRDLVAAGATAGAALQGMRLAIDCAHGATATTAPEVFRRLGAELIAIADAPDGDHINDGVGALHPETVGAAVAEHGAIAGFAFDGDGDRLVAVDEAGTPRDGDALLYILAREFRSGSGLTGDTVVGTVMTNAGLERALGDDGIALVRTPVGDRHILAQCRTNGYAMGSEPSGHVVLWRGGGLRGDATLAALEVLGTMIRRGKTLAELCGGFVAFPQVLVSVQVHERPPLEEVAEVRDALAEARTAIGEDGRILARYSGTEPVARIMLEGEDREVLEAQAGRIAWAIRSTLGDRRDSRDSGTIPDATS
jgi:phosphoglucosamine mutase